MRNIIEMNQEYFLVCDNKKFDYQLTQNDENRGHEIEYIVVQCHKCGENLLTTEDYLNHKKIMNVIKWINKWFSWLTLFSGKVKEEDYKSITFHVHDGIKFEDGNVRNKKEVDHV